MCKSPLVVVVTLALIVAWPNVLAGETPSGSFVITGVRVFDGTATIEDATVVVLDGTIREVGTDLEVRGDLPRVEGERSTLLPGFIDSHTHSWGNALERALLFGVTTNIDMFGDEQWAEAMRKEQRRGPVFGRADLVSAGTLATAPGGHGTQFGMTIDTLTAPDQAAGWVQDRIAAGSDFIKIVSEDGASIGQEIPTLDDATIEAVIDAAHEADLLAVVHATVAVRAESALRSGADGLVHLFGDTAASDDFVELARDRGVFIVPTLTIIESTMGVATGAGLVTDPRFEPYLERTEKANLQRSFPGRGGTMAPVLDSLGRLAAAGVPILAGSDSPNTGTTYGASMHRELELLVEAGLEPAAALAAATSVPASIFGLDDRGRIEPGRRADLVLVSGDPTTEITDTRAIRAVWKAGRAVERPVAKVTAETTAPAPAVPASGLVADFETEELTATFGAGWIPSTDSMMGGSSTVALATVVADGGAGRVLEIRGDVREGFAFPWAGAMFFPGSIPMTPANLSSFQGFSFEAAGDEGTYRVLVFATSLGQIPAERSFATDGTWREHRFSFQDFGVDGSDVTGIFFGGGSRMGEFRLLIDDVRLHGDAPQ